MSTTAAVGAGDAVIVGAAVAVATTGAVVAAAVGTAAVDAGWLGAPAHDTTKTADAMQTAA
ncbi:MAG: hypothetical protein ACRDF9_04235 [Candidatus Limnocylindria bacterium]